MKIAAPIFAAFLLAGCNEGSPASAEKPSTLLEQTAKWAIAPAISGADGMIHYVWRINTQTGALEICAYATSWEQKDSAGILHFASPKCSDAPTMPPDRGGMRYSN